MDTLIDFSGLSSADLEELKKIISCRDVCTFQLGGIKEYLCVSSLSIDLDRARVNLIKPHIAEHPKQNPENKTLDLIKKECAFVSEFLSNKNKAYGDSALDPIRFFSKADKREQLLLRIDDKLSRIKRGSEFLKEDSLLDLIGYLVMLRISLKKPDHAETEAEPTEIPT